MNTETTLITGGRGFVGTNLTQAIKSKRKLRVIDSFYRSSPTGWTDGIADEYRLDILDLESLVPAFVETKDVVHLAAYGSVVESIKSPQDNFLVNAQGTLNVLRAAVTAKVRRLIFASTGGALIGDSIPPVNEHSLPKPISPYGASKLCGEAYCHAFAKSFGIETICLRFANVYGPHSVHKKGAVTTFIKALIKDEPIVIYGDGSASRDYIHVDDLCSGIEAALDISAPDLAGEVFHLASGRETSVIELAHILCDVAGKPNHPIEFRPVRRGEVARNFATYDKAHDLFGFEPRWSIEEGLAVTWEWFIKQGASVFDVDTADS